MNRSLYEVGDLVDDAVLESLGEGLLEFVHGLEQLVGDFDCVGTWRLVHDQCGCLPPVVQRLEVIGFSTQVDFCHVFDSNGTGAFAGFENDLLKLFDIGEPTKGVDIELIGLILGNGRLAELARRDLDILLP